MSGALLRCGRGAHLFSTQGKLMESFKTNHEPLFLASDQLLHALVPADLVVRRGILRISQFLPNGREVTRAVLQAGSFLVTRPAQAGPGNLLPNPAADIYDLADIVLMALSEAELWSLPAGSLDQID